MIVHQNSSLRLSWICTPIASGGSLALSAKRDREIDQVAGDEDVQRGAGRGHEAKERVDLPRRDDGRRQIAFQRKRRTKRRSKRSPGRARIAVTIQKPRPSSDGLRFVLNQRALSLNVYYRAVARAVRTD